VTWYFATVFSITYRWRSALIALTTPIELCVPEGCLRFGK
jgi:hypothetical protein